MIQITLTKTSFEKKEGTKTVWIETEKETRIVNRDFYRNAVDSVGFFRRLGGSETLQYSYTCDGYKCTKLISTSPDKQVKKVYEFTFENVVA